MVKKEVLVLIVFLLIVNIVSAQNYNKIGENLTIGNTIVEIIDIGSSDVLVDVNGKRGVAFLNATVWINGVNVTVVDIFYHSSPGSRLTYILLATASEYKEQTCTENSECDDNDPCTLDKCTGNPSRCDYDDSHFEINYCITGDNCCNSAYCSWKQDGDCPREPACVVDSDCRDDNDLSTETVCENNECKHVEITECVTGDGYCPDGCFYSINNDQDCGKSNKCRYNTECNDNNPCTRNDSCRANALGIKECYAEVVNECISGDGCCPRGCSYPADLECKQTGEVNIEEKGTITYSCVKDVDCGSLEYRCVENRCVEDAGGKLSSKGESIFVRFINLLKRLFIPG